MGQPARGGHLRLLLPLGPLLLLLLLPPDLVLFLLPLLLPLLLALALALLPAVVRRYGPEHLCGPLLLCPPPCPTEPGRQEEAVQVHRR